VTYGAEWPKDNFIVGCCTAGALPRSRRSLGKANLKAFEEEPVSTTAVTQTTDVVTRGVLYVHASPSALCPHVEWAAAGVLGVAVNLSWIPQPAATGTYRAELSWQGYAGTAAKLASALRGWDRLLFEVSEEPTASTEGARYSFTPDLGLFHAVTGLHGDLMIPEDRLKAAVVKAAIGDLPLIVEIDKLLGKAWDEALEPFRYAGEGAPVRWLHQVV
jgi:hypothetical protein